MWTWLSHSHIWLGKLVMCAGWANLAGGMVMGGHRLSYVASIAAVSATEALGLVLWLWWRKRRHALQEDSQDLNARMKRHSVTRGMERYFALTDGEDEDPFKSKQKEHIKKNTQG
ncbi:MAG: hypothetical protein M1821_004451 [Bathelium mastoideum]|nr:MAG: hypothetical protein M1821_004451 [Bathelium mastoideum]